MTNDADLFYVQQHPASPTTIRTTVHGKLQRNVSYEPWYVAGEPVFKNPYMATHRRFASSVRLILQCEDPDGPAFGDLGVLPREGAIQVRLHTARIAAPTRVNCDVLFAIDGERSRRREDA